MLISVLKNQKTGGSLDNFYSNNWKKKGGKIGMGTLYLVFCNFQGLDKGLIRLKK